MIVLSESSTNLNAYNPWPGLAAYDEASSAFFFGRQNEADELFRLIRLAPLTVVYGKSGLGKTSLLQAGLYPKLREQHYLPIHVRLEFSDIVKDPPLQQVMRRLREELDKEKAEYPEPRKVSSLWEYLHRKDLKIWTHDNFPLTPVLVFDQFEELFTHRSSDVELITNVMYSLADLIENRFPPEVINEESGTVRSTLDLLSQRYRIVLSFREDFLPEVQAWEQKVPSLLKNYLRLNPMSRECAIEAVTLAGKEVLNTDVAPSIVDLVGKRDHDVASMAEMVIEPVLLSLCCSRLNARRGDGTKIDQALVEQTGKDILEGFYREALDDDEVKGPPDVALFIEDYLIQGDHFRGAFPNEEALDKNLLTKKQLAALTDRHRLLRLVHHPDTTRVELIHDRLVPVVRKARDERKIKKHQEEQERLTREAQAKAANLKKIGLLIALLFLMTVVGAGWAVMSGRRAEQARNSAETAQQRAEDLLGFLLGEQFLGEIRDVGRSSMLEQVKRKVQTYANDRDPRTALIRGLALRNAGDLQRTHGELEHSVRSFENAQEAIKSSPDTPDRARETARTHERLGEALAAQGHVTQALNHYEAAVEVWSKITTDAAVKVDDCTSFADSLVSTGELNNRMGKTTLAGKNLAKALNIVTNVPFGRCGQVASKVAPYPDAKALEVLSRAQMLRANIYYLTEDYEGAVRLAREATRLSPASTSATRQKATALAYLANSRFFEKPHHALQDYHRVLAEFDELRRQDPTNRLWEREYAAVQLLIAEGTVACNQSKTKDCKSMSSLKEAEITNLKGTATLSALAKIDRSDMAWQRDLGWARQGRAKVLAAQARLPERLAALQESERLYNDSILDHRSDVEGMIQLAATLLDQSKALADLDRWSEAKATLQRSIVMFEHLDLTAQEESLVIVGYLLDARALENKILRKTEDKKGADLTDQNLKRLEDRYQHLSQIGKQEKADAETFNDSHFTHVSKGAELFRRSEHTAALTEFRAAESAMREYIGLQPTAFSGYNNLRNVYNWIQLTHEKLGNTREGAAARSLLIHMAWIATLLKPEHDAQPMDDHLRAARRTLGLSFYNSNRLTEALAVVQEEVADAEAIVQKDPKNPDRLSDLSNAHYGHGLVRRAAQKAGWEEAVRIGIVYLQTAAAIDRENLEHHNKLGEMRKYLADQLDADGLKEKSLVEYGLALKAYQRAAKLSPRDETALKGISDLAELGIR